MIMEMIMGNNDFFSQLEREKEIMIGKYKVLLTHGHYYNVSTGPAYLKQEAKERGFDIVMFGHTHRPYFDIDKSGEKEPMSICGTFSGSISAYTGLMKKLAIGFSGSGT